MSESLSSWRFVAIWIVALVIAVGYAAGNIPWDKFL